MFIQLYRLILQQFIFTYITAMSVFVIVLVDYLVQVSQTSLSIREYASITHEQIVYLIRTSGGH